MRRVPALPTLSALTVAIVVAGGALAQVAPPPPKLEPITEKPPAIIGFDEDLAAERGVRLAPGAAERVEEAVIDGRRVVRVINPSGYEYELTEDLGDGTHAGQEPHDSKVRAPRWVILRF